MYWWETLPRENVFVEITRRTVLGEDLRAPLIGREGVRTPGYTMVSQMRPGNIVVHYKSDDEEIVGVSKVSREPEQSPVFWAARGSSARQANEEPHWQDGLKVPLRARARIT
jgi:hypothetical protein